MSTERKPVLPSTQEAILMASAAADVEQLEGTVLVDRYRLVSLLGSGGGAAVYRAEHSIMRKALAVKVLRPELVARQDFVQRFLAEARAVARLRHDGIPDVYDVGRTEEGLVFIAMELLEGEDLATVLERSGPMPWSRARDITLQVCRALAAAHAEGLVHRDVKPQNCFCLHTGDGRDVIKLLDFGIAKQLDGGQGLTATGVIMGTAEYMSPEQARGQDVDARADVYSVCAMLFELLSGRAPFEGETFIDVLTAQMTQPPPRLSLLVPHVDASIDAVIEKGLAKRPDDRFANMEELIDALQRVDERTQRVPVYQPAPRAAAAPATQTGVKVALGAATALIAALGAVIVYLLLSGPREATSGPAIQVAAPTSSDGRGSPPAPAPDVTLAYEPAGELEAPPSSAIDATDQIPASASEAEQGDGIAGDGGPDAPQVKETSLTEVATHKRPAKRRRRAAATKKVKTSELKDRLREACRDAAGLRDHRVIISVPAAGKRTLQVLPRFLGLEECLQRQARSLPRGTGTYTLKFTMAPRGR